MAEKNTNDCLMKPRRMWSGRETLALLQCHAKHRIELKTRKRKVIGYEEILQDLERMHILTMPATAYQVETKLRTLLKAYKFAINSEMSNTPYCVAPFMREMEQIYGTNNVENINLNVVNEQSTEPLACDQKLATKNTEKRTADELEINNETNGGAIHIKYDSNGNKKTTLSRRTWSNVETNELLKQYLKHRREMDNSTSKIAVYEKILKELKRTNVLAKPTNVMQLENKMRALFKAYKRSVKSNMRDIPNCVLPFMSKMKNIYENTDADNLSFSAGNNLLNSKSIGQELCVANKSFQDPDNEDADTSVDQELEKFTFVKVELSDTIICGEIHRCAITHVLSLVCTICRDHFTDLTAYSSHLICHFGVDTPIDHDISSDNKNTESKIDSIDLKPVRESMIISRDGTNISNSTNLLNSCNETTSSSVLKEKTPSYESKKTVDFSCCLICKQEFDTMIDYEAHIAIDNSENKKLICPYSYKTGSRQSCHLKTQFGNRCMLQRHLRGHGQYPKRYPCDSCKRIFKSPKGLQLHRTLHTGDRPYKCDICKKSFALYSYLGTHMRLHTGEKPELCQKCGRSFATKSRLSLHMRRHNGDLKRQTCSVCGQGFMYPSQLTVHMRVHTGEKPFACKLCGKLYRSNLLVRQHERMHNPEKIHACRFCDLKFTQSSNRRLHERQEHNIV